jgi:hypothetical protein
MRRMLILTVLTTTTPAFAADGSGLTPLADAPLPMPTPVVAPPLGGVPVGFYRPSRLDVWQYYAVDRAGNFRPRVALRPEGSFYLLNGAPYYLLPIRERDVMTYIFD